MHFDARCWMLRISGEVSSLGGARKLMVRDRVYWLLGAPLKEVTRDLKKAWFPKRNMNSPLFERIHFLCSSPKFLGFMIQFDDLIFQMGGKKPPIIDMDQADEPKPRMVFGNVP